MPARPKKHREKGFVCHSENDPYVCASWTPVHIKFYFELHATLKSKPLQERTLHITLSLAIKTG